MDGWALVPVAHGTTLVGATTFLQTVNPTPGVLPGGNWLGTMINGIAGWALLFALAGLLVGAALWALGSHSQNYQQSYVGKRAVMASALAALLVGVAPGLINFFFHAGATIK
jgi:hypothetical protein